jgi:hypothetical protein
MRPPWQRHARLVNLALLALCASLARAQSAAPPPPSPGASALAPSPPASAASPPVSSAAIEEAKQRYTQALELFQEGNFEASLLEFRKSYELSGSFKLLYNMALVSKQMNNHVRAIRFLEQYMREGGGEIKEERAAEVRKELTRLQGRVGRVLVTVKESGAEILVDDVFEGKSPLSGPLLVNAGRRKISAQLAGKIPVVRVIEVTGGDSSTLELTFAEAPAPIVTTIIREQPQGPPTWPFWLGAGTFAAGGLLTGVLAVRATSDARAQQDRFGASSAGIEEAQSRARNLALATDVLVGAALVTGGVGLYFTLRPSRTDVGGVSLHPQPSGLSLRGKF